MTNSNFSNPEKIKKSNKSLINTIKDDEHDKELVNKTPKSSTVLKSSFLLNDKEKNIPICEYKNNKEINFAINNPMINEIISNKSETINKNLCQEINSPIKLIEKEQKCDKEHDIIGVRLDNILKNIISKGNKKK